MCAAASTPGTQSKYKDSDMTMIKMLLKIGADKNIISNKGLTAYGLFLQSVQSNKDFMETFGMSSDSKHLIQLANILKPTNGRSSKDLEIENRLTQFENQDDS